MAKKGKKIQEVLKKVDATRVHSIEEAVALAKDANITKFDAIVEVAYKSDVDPKKTDQQIRGAVVLLNGIDKIQTISVFAKGEKAGEAETAGVGFVDDDGMVAKIQGGWFDFDIVVAIPDMTVTAGKLGRVSGLEGLTSNPKADTATMDVTRAVEEIKTGKITYHIDKAGSVHVPISRVSFDNEKLIENFDTINGVLLKVKPSTTRDQYIENILAATTFGPEVHVNQAFSQLERK